MANNLELWSALERTDPAHTKSFSRAGGFRGTAMRPIFNIKRMTEQFGPCGIGWGMTKPEFQTVNGDGELLVFCTVAIWHGARENLVYGVGGDKVVTKRRDGSFNNDEAFKSAFTDAVSNSMKNLGVGADIHMGLFDDEKYVRDLGREFNQDEPDIRTRFFEDAKLAISNHVDATALKAWGDANGSHLDALPTDQAEHLRKQYKARMKALTEPLPKGSVGQSTRGVQNGIDLSEEIPFSLEWR